MKLLSQVIISSTLFISINSFAATTYVNINAPGGNGTSWAQAYNNLQTALDNAPSGNQIWIAKGTYIPSMPNTGDPRLKTFNLSNNVALYGGFSGGESSLSQSKPSINKTILSGDLNGDDVDISNANYDTSRMDNAYHIVTAGAVITSLNGLFFQAGNASLLDDHGGALLAQSGSEISLNNNVFQYNSADKGGGAVYISGPNSKLTVTSSRFSYNKNTNPVVVDNGGGALFAVALTSLNIDNSSFNNNFAGEDGGAVRIDNTSGSITNSKFQNNEADHSAGALVINNSFNSPSVYTFTMSDLYVYGNVAHSFGGGFALFNPFGNPNNTVTINKSIFQNNKTTYLDDGVFRLGGDGGAIIMTDLTTSISNSQFTNNTAVNSGGAIGAVNFYESLFGSPNRAHLTITETLFTGNHAQGAAQQLYDNLGAAFGLPFTDNFGGGAIRTGAGMVATVSKSVFSNNDAVGNGGAIQNADMVSSPFPGFYLVYDGTLNVSNSVFSSNSATLNGGGISSVSLVPSNVPGQLPVNLSVTGSTFKKNQAVNLGNGIYILNSPNTLNGNYYGNNDDVFIAP